MDDPQRSSGRIRGTKGYGISGGPSGDQSGLAPENFTTLAHFSTSSARNLPKSAGDPASSDAPKSASRAFDLESARTALISLLSLSTMSAGVFLGAPTPAQALVS